MSFKASCLLDAGIINEGEKQWADARVLSVLAGGMIASGSHSRIAANIRQAATLFDRHGLYDLGALARRGSEHFVRFAVAPGRGLEDIEDTRSACRKYLTESYDGIERDAVKSASVMNAAQARMKKPRPTNDRGSACQTIWCRHAFGMAGSMARSRQSVTAGNHLLRNSSIRRKCKSKKSVENYFQYACVRCSQWLSKRMPRSTIISS